ncbi:hypothetical protein Esti_004564 [Eimeria stiedai]
MSSIVRHHLLLEFCHFATSKLLERKALLYSLAALASSSCWRSGEAEVCNSTSSCPKPRCCGGASESCPSARSRQQSALRAQQKAAGAAGRRRASKASLRLPPRPMEAPRLLAYQGADGSASLPAVMKIPDSRLVCTGSAIPREA